MHCFPQSLSYVISRGIPVSVRKCSNFLVSFPKQLCMSAFWWAQINQRRQTSTNNHAERSAGEHPIWRMCIRAQLSETQRGNTHSGEVQLSAAILMETWACIKYETLFFLWRCSLEHSHFHLCALCHLNIWGEPGGLREWAQIVVESKKKGF